jgi:hypothetical protein
LKEGEEVLGVNRIHHRQCVLEARVCLRTYVITQALTHVGKQCEEFQVVVGVEGVQDAICQEFKLMPQSKPLGTQSIV